MGLADRIREIQQANVRAEVGTRSIQRPPEIHTPIISSAEQQQLTPEQLARQRLEHGLSAIGARDLLEEARKDFWGGKGTIDMFPRFIDMFPRFHVRNTYYPPIPGNESTFYERHKFDDPAPIKSLSVLTIRYQYSYPSIENVYKDIATSRGGEAYTESIFVGTRRFNQTEELFIALGLGEKREANQPRGFLIRVKGVGLKIFDLQSDIDSRINPKDEAEDLLASFLAEVPEFWKPQAHIEQETRKTSWFKQFFR